MKKKKLATELTQLFNRAVSVKAVGFDQRVNYQETFYSDVEGTKTQFSDKQLKFIDQTYKVPISTKVSYPIIEQMLSILTATKPYPRLISTEESTSEFTQTYEKAYHGCWYESKASDQLKKAWTDTLTTGSGFLHVRKANFFNESTFNVVLEHVNWKNVFWDPYSVKPNLEDADYVVIAKVLLKDKAEREYDIRISNDNQGMDYEALEIEYGKFINTPVGWHTNDKDKDNFVWIKEFYRKINKNVYVSDEGHVSTKRPETITIPNPAYQQLVQQEQLMIEQINKVKNAEMDLKDEVASSPTPLTGEENAQQVNEIEQVEQQSAQANEQLQQIEQQLQQLQMIKAQTPQEIPAFELVINEDTDNEKTVVVANVTKIKKKRIQRILMVGDQIVEKEYIPGEYFPIIHFNILCGNTSHDTYGIMHFISDIQKGLNKSWSHALYDMAQNNSKKVMYPQGAIMDPAKVEKDWAKPTAFIEYVPQMNLPNGGLPQVIEPTPLSPATQFVFQAFMQLIEYITGFNNLMQGNPDTQTPRSFGGIRALQVMGIQRIKSYARSLEEGLQNLAYVIINYLQRYIPRDKVLKYIDDNGDEAEIKILEAEDDLQFKVRVEIADTVPTTQQMHADILGTIAGQTKDPNVANFLTKRMLEISDIPKGKEMAQQVDIIQQMQQQLQQLQEQLKQSEGKNKTLTQNLEQMKIKEKVDKASAGAEKKIAVDSQKALDEIDKQEEIASLEEGDSIPQQEPSEPSELDNLEF